VTQTMLPSGSGAMDSLRISDEQATALLGQLESLSLSSPRIDQRAAPRVSTGTRARVIVEIRPEGGVPVHYLARPRNISRNGMAFLHGGYVHENASVIVQLKLGGKAFRLDSRVIRCRYVDGSIHEVGVEFDRRIDP